MSNATSHEVSPQQHQSPLALAQPEVSRATPEGRLGEAWPVTIPEQVVGSSHTFEFPSPKNLSSIGAVGVITLDGSSDLTVGWTAPTPVPCMGTGALKITFAPTKTGPQHAVMTLVTKWEDGHVERRTIQVTAQARALDAVPASETSAGPVHASRGLAVAPKGPDRALMVNEKHDWDKVDAVYNHLMKEQHDGIQLVETESHKFKPRPAERSIWQDLAEIAFQLGTGAIAGVVAKFVASKVSKAVVNAEQAVATAQAGEAQIAAAEKKVIAAQGDVAEEYDAQRAVVAAKVGNYANQSAAKHAKFAEGEVGALAGGAVLKVMTTTASEIRGPQDSGGGSKENAEASTTSEDAEIGFFSDQYEMSNALADEGATKLSAVLAEQLKSSPEVAPQVMEGIVDGLQEAISGQQAKKQQAINTSSQFMTYLARTNLGVEKVKTPHGDAPVTDMSGQRGHGDSLLESASLATGVLEIACEHQRGGATQVVDARAKNVSHLVVNRLLDVPLAHSGIPIRLALSGGVIITRDEAGRVRVSGLLDLGPPHTEEQQIAEAERIFHVVFSKTLKAWGVPQIHTNDATQGADPSPKASKHA